MISFPNAKINLGLRVCERRSDGYHELETVFVPIPLCDILEIVDASQTEFEFSGLPIPGALDSNLLVKVWERFQTDFKLPAQKILLHKKIPMGAGLGGGSADAAFFIKLLNQKFELNLSTIELQQFARKFGADCAFFIENKTVLARGIGDLFSNVELPTQQYYILLVKPPVHVSTAQAYGNVIPAKPSKSISTILKQPISTWKAELINDFETGVFKIYPELAAIKQKLYDMGAIYAAMSGSGSTLFGLYVDKPDFSDFENDNFVFCEKIKF
ncbi:MAG: 4-(cytidine 5'-diphospho)-2-C-methyl-D-erythritol kinase [Pedobacter sp.]|nr:MAG: 4-(cytidine 5'-diphospho)-2-C-methyl-D-erythritol kinase [Pedobacter sp.]